MINNDYNESNITCSSMIPIQCLNPDVGETHPWVAKVPHLRSSISVLPAQGRMVPPGPHARRVFQGMPPAM